MIDLSQEACDKRLYDALVEITKNPAHWEQRYWGGVHGHFGRPPAFLQSNEIDRLNREAKTHSWPCGTAGCLAGTVILAEGLAEFECDGTLVVKEDEVTARSEGEIVWFEASSFVFVGGLLLGLNQRGALQLFRADNTLTELWRLAELFTQGRVSMPAELVDDVRAIDEERTCDAFA